VDLFGEDKTPTQVFVNSAVNKSRGLIDWISDVFNKDPEP
jgi:hypothetical protein